MRFHALALAATAMAAASTDHEHDRRAVKKVAIIGAGAAGASAAYHLTLDARAASTPISIHIYDSSPFAGGRSTTVNAWSSPAYPIELGASIFVDVNHILVNATRTFGLRLKSEDLITTQGLPDLGIWNGREMLVTINGGESGAGGWWDTAKLLWRYGYAPVRVNGLMKGVVGKFLKMYEEIEAGGVFPWGSLTGAVDEVGLGEVVGVTGRQYLEKEGAAGKFADEVVQASTRVNYAANLGLIHGVEAMVCMATSGAMSIEGGNWRIFDAMVYSSPDIHPQFNTTISSITKHSHDGTFTVSTSPSSADTDEAFAASSFDEVILAAPYHQARISVTPPPAKIPDDIPYIDLHVTLFATRHALDPAFFNLPANTRVPQHVLTTLPTGEDHGSKPAVGSPGFFSISIVGEGVNPEALTTWQSSGQSEQGSPQTERIYKIFSAKPVDAKFLSSVLGRHVSDAEAAGEGDNAQAMPEKEQKSSRVISWIHRKEWLSYPVEYPRVTFDELRLALKGDDEDLPRGGSLWYTAAIEPFISTMETSALAGRNVARLILDGWRKERSSQQGDGGSETSDEAADSGADVVDELENKSEDADARTGEVLRDSTGTSWAAGLGQQVLMPVVRAGARLRARL